MSMVSETMTSRERMMRALNHEIPDRVPIDLGGNQTGIHKDAYVRLLDHLSIKDDLRIMDAVQQLAQPCEELLERFHVDTRYIAAGPPSDWKGGIVENVRDGRLWYDLTDEFGVTWSMPDDSPLYMDISHHPLAQALVEDLEDYPFPTGGDPTRFEGLRKRALTLKKETPYAIIGGISGVVYETCWYMRGMEQWLCDLLTDPAFCEVLMEKILRFWMEWFKLYLDEVHDIVDVIMIGDDIAGQQGPIFRPEIYESLVKPRHKRLVQYIKSRTSAKVWYHTCGACKSYIPTLLDNGIDALNPVQISASGMDPGELKERFGRQLVFWGGAIDAQHVLPFAKPDEIREEVRRHLEIWKAGGGYVFNSVHNIQGDVPPENIIAMYDSAYEFGFYD